ncbi:MAG: MazG-related protein [Ktedonobacteraceae bacterium]
MLEVTNDPQKIGQALNWIVSLLNHYDVPYQICGGLAAKAYGATRPLVDIDIYALLQATPHFQAFIDDIKPYTIREFMPHLSASWDLIYLEFNYQGMHVEIGESTTPKPRFYNHRDGRWEDQPINFAASNMMQIYGVEVAIMPKHELLIYKAMLNREVDRLDIEQITASSGNEEEKSNS